MADLPIGSIIFFAGVGAPNGWLVMGDDVSRTTYSALFGVVGTLFGEGDGSTTFGTSPDTNPVLLPGAVPSHGKAIIKYL